MNQNIIRLFLFLFAVVAMSACKKKTDHIDISDFYYPADRLTEHGLVYEYHAVNNDSLPPEYWYFRSLQTDTALYLTGTYYDEFFNVRQFFSSEIVSNGVLLIDQSISIVDSTGQLIQHHAEVIYNNVFPFEVRDSGGIFLMQLKWVFADNPPVTTTLTRNRQYSGRRSYIVEGENVEVAVLTLREEVDDQNNGHWTREYEGVEYYAKNIGLVYYKKEIDENFILEYELRKRYPMSELEKKFKQQLEE
ncbi:MAG: hypothetical protein ACI8YQ_001520 [Polaribacter sp.]|jgi:hypothetical protein